MVLNFEAAHHNFGIGDTQNHPKIKTGDTPDFGDGIFPELIIYGCISFDDIDFGGPIQHCLYIYSVYIYIDTHGIIVLLTNIDNIITSTNSGPPISIGNIQHNQSTWRWGKRLKSLETGCKEEYPP